MKQEKIIALLQSRMEKIKEHFYKLQQNLAPEELHNYRLEMKKLKAFIRLLNTKRPAEKKIKVGRKMKDFYRIAGNLRNLQLHQQRIIEAATDCHLAKPVAYLMVLSEEIKNAMEQLYPAAKKISFHAFSKYIQDSAPLSLNTVVCRHYLMQQYHALGAILLPAFHSDEALHEARKIAKDIGYNRNYVSSLLPLIVPAFLTDKEQTDAITEKLGTYHDLCISLFFLQPSYTDWVAEKRERAVLQQLKNALESARQAMKLKVIELFNDIKFEAAPHSGNLH